MKKKLEAEKKLDKEDIRKYFFPKKWLKSFLRDDLKVSDILATINFILTHIIIISINIDLSVSRV